MDFFTGGGDDEGWDDDGDLDELSVDFSSDAQDTQDDQTYEEDTTNTSEAATGQASIDNGMSIGGGMFMGRLTRFIEDLTQPEDEEGDGWEDDDDNFDFDDDDENTGEQTSEWDEDDVPQQDSSLNVSEQVVMPPATSESQLMDSGWEDDEDLDLQDLDTPQSGVAGAAAFGFTSVMSVPLNNVPQEQTSVPPPPPPIPPPPDNKQSRTVSFDKALGNPSFVPPPPPPPPPPPAAPLVEQSPSVSVALDDSMMGEAGSGWDDDIDLGLETTDDGADPDGDNAETQEQSMDVEESLLQPSAPFEDSTLGTSTAAAIIDTEYGENTFATEEEDGWGDGEDGLDVLNLEDDAMEDKESNLNDENAGLETSIVDSTPPPPPPPHIRHDGAAIASEGAIMDEGWDESNEDLDEVVGDVVDHVPRPDPGFVKRAQSQRTDYALEAGEDDISRDSTLSVDNSRSQLLPQSNNNMVDRTPSLTSPVHAPRMLNVDNSLANQSTLTSTSALDDQADDMQSNSMVPLGGGASIGDSLDSGDVGPQRRGTKKVVDQTPPGPKSFHRALTIDAAGHISIGESLDSIDEETSLSPGEEATTPAAVEAGMGEQGLSFSGEGRQPVDVPFGSALSPAARQDSVPLVDHTPSIATDRPTGAEWTAVLGDTTIGGDLGEASRDSVNDDVEENLYGKVVDHTPENPSEAKKVTAQTPLSTRLEDDTVQGVAEMIDVESDYRRDDDMDDEESAEVSTTGGGWPRQNVDASEAKEKHLVDHVPKQKPNRVTNASIRVLVDTNDDMTQVDTIAEDEAMDFGPVVDHLPLSTKSKGNSVTASMMTQNTHGAEKAEDDMDNTTALGASIAETSGWDDDIPELEDGSVTEKNTANLQKGGEDNLVDHVPGRGDCRPTDASTMVQVDPLDVISEVDDYDERGSRYGLVVDQTPAPALSSRSSVQASMRTKTGETEADARADDGMDATWFGASTVGGLSTLGAASAGCASGADSATEEGNGWEDDGLGVLMSPLTDRRQHAGDQDHLVDRIPRLGSPTPIDSSTAAHAEPSVLSGEGKDDAEGESLGDEEDDQIPPLVDHVPDQTDTCRPRDASTIVAADPSELNSQSDYFGQEEIFGPVVDQTPTPQNFSSRPPTGSTIVALESVADDDLDLAVEKAIDGEDPSAGRQTPNEWNQMPNPQADDSSDREQVVDFVPEEERDAVPDIVRDGSSEMATIDGKSSIPVDEPKEEEFGPVVDHTPQGESPTVEAKGSTANNAAATKRGNGFQNVDSVAPLFSIASKEKNEDGLEDDQFGPVVDQLPTSSSRLSLAASRGGSTVDALATVSEVDVDDDLITGDGWEDDTDIDVGDLDTPAASTQAGDDKSLSVSWVDRQEKSGRNSSKQARNGSFFDTKMDASQLTVNETKYYDANESAWESSLNSMAKTDDDSTPPATPKTPDDFQDSTEAMGGFEPQTSDIAQLQNLLNLNQGKKRFEGRLQSTDGEWVTVDFEDLLKDEMTKRLLIEKEVEALRKSNELLKSAKESLVTVGEAQANTVNDLSANLESARTETETLRSEKESLINKDSDNTTKLSSLWKEVSGLRTMNSDLQEQMQALKAEGQQSVLHVSRQLEEQEKSMSQEIKRWQESHDSISEKASLLETECTILSGKNSSLMGDLEALRKSLYDLKTEKDNATARESALTVEITNLESLLQKQSAEFSSQSNLEEELRSVQRRLASKEGEVSKLTTEQSLLEQRLATSGAESFKQSKELARLQRDKNEDKKQHEEQINLMQSQLRKVQEASEVLSRDMAKKEAEAEERFEQLRSKHVQLKTEYSTALSTQKLDMSTEQQKRRDLEQSLRQSESTLEVMREEMGSLSTQLEEYKQKAAESESSFSELQSISQERDDLRQEVVRSKQVLQDLEWQTKNDMEAVESQLTEELETLRKESSSSNSQLQSYKQQVEKLTNDLDEVVADKTELSHRCQGLEKQLASLEAEKSRRSGPSEEELTSLNSIRTDIEKLQAELSNARDEKDEMESTLNESSTRCSGLEDELKQVRKERDSAAHKKDVIEKHLMETRTKLRSSSEEKAQIVKARDELIARCRDLEASLVSSENAGGDGHVSQEMLDQVIAERNKLQQELSEARTANTAYEEAIQDLERQVLDAESVVANKEQMIVILREQQSSSRAGFQDLRKTNKELEAKIAELESQIFSLEENREEVHVATKGNEAYVEQLREDFDALADERDDILNERNQLVEENEEMLVQFGLVKVDMDELEAEIEQLKDQLEERDAAAEESARKLQEAESRLQGIQATANNDMALKRELLDLEERYRSERNGLEHQLADVLAMKQSAESDLQQLRAAESRSAQLIQTLEAQLERFKSNANDMVPQHQLLDLEERFHAEREGLENELEEVLSMKNDAESKLGDSQSEQTRLMEEVKALEAKLDEQAKAADLKVERLTSIIENMEEKEQELADQCFAQERRLDDLRAHLEHAQSDASHTTATLAKRVQGLQSTITEQKRLLGQRDAELENLENMLDAARTSPQERDEVEQLRASLREMRSKIETDQFRMKELEQISNQRQQEVDRVRSELASAKNVVLILENENLSLQTADAQSKELETSLQGDLTARAQELLEAQQEVANLRRTVELLEQEVEDSYDRQKYEQATQEPSGESAAELESLRQQVESLKSAQASQTEERTAMLSAQVNDLQLAVRQKDGQISTLEHQVSALSNDLALSREKIQVKKNDLQKLFSENRELRTMAAQQPTTHVLASTAAQQAESVDTMRSQLIALAQALNKSETNRADAIEKLETERKDNADSLRRITASVKRFYTQLQHGD